MNFIINLNVLCVLCYSSIDIFKYHNNNCETGAWLKETIDGVNKRTMHSEKSKRDVHK